MVLLRCGLFRRPSSKHIDLLPQHQDFRFQLCSQPKERSQDANNQLEHISHQAQAYPVRSLRLRRIEFFGTDTTSVALTSAEREHSPLPSDVIDATRSYRQLRAFGGGTHEPSAERMEHDMSNEMNFELTSAIAFCSEASLTISTDPFRLRLPSPGLTRRGFVMAVIRSRSVCWLARLGLSRA
jgi:hypothetical protein